MRRNATSKRKEGRTGNRFRPTKFMAGAFATETEERPQERDRVSAPFESFSGASETSLDALRGDVRSIGSVKTWSFPLVEAICSSRSICGAWTCFCITANILVESRVTVVSCFCGWDGAVFVGLSTGFLSASTSFIAGQPCFFG